MLELNSDEGTQAGGCVATNQMPVGYDDVDLRGCVPVNPRSTADIRFDGGDRVVTGGGPVGMVHTQEPEMDTAIHVQGIIAGSTEMLSQQAVENATSYSIPVGEDLYADATHGNCPAFNTGISLDNISSASFDPPGGNTVSWAHTVGTGSDRKLIVGISAEDFAGCTAEMDVTAVTFNGDSLSPIPGATACTTDQDHRIEMWYLDDPDVVTSGTILVTLSGTATDEVNAGAVSLEGAAGSLPEATANNEDDSGADTIITNIATGTENAWVIDMVGNGNPDSFNQGATSQIEIFDIAGGSATGAMSRLEDVPAATSPNIEETADVDANRLAHGVIRIAPAVPVATETGRFCPFQYTELNIVAFEDDTDVTVDNGTTSVSFTFEKGQHWRSGDGSFAGPGTLPTATSALTIDSGTKISTDKAVSSLLFTGSDGNFQTRFYAVLPDLLHGSDYVTTAPGDDPNDPNGPDDRPLNLYIFNPDPVNAIQVTATDTTGSFTFTVQPNSQVDYATASENATGTSRFVPSLGPGTAPSFIPSTSTVRLTSDRNFWGVSAYQHDGVTSDWGHSWLATKFLTGTYSVSFAPDLAGVTEVAAVHAAALQDNTCVRVDFDNDGNFDDIGDGAGGTTPRLGSGPCTDGYFIDALQTLPIWDASDDDNTGTRISANKPISVAYGQHTDFSAGGQAIEDFGYTVYPVNQLFLDPVLTADKTADVTSIPLSTTTRVTYTIEVSTGDFGPLTGVTVTDFLPSGVTSSDYVTGSTVITFPDLSQSFDDPDTGTADRLVFDLDPGGGTTTTLARIAHEGDRKRLLLMA